MGDPLTVYAFLKRHRHEGFCDACIASSTGVDRRHVELIASTLLLFSAEFTRTEQPCPQGCGGGDKEVTAAI